MPRRALTVGGAALAVIGLTAGPAFAHAGFNGTFVPPGTSASPYAAGSTTDAIINAGDERSLIDPADGRSPENKQIVIKLPPGWTGACNGGAGTTSTATTPNTVTPNPAWAACVASAGNTVFTFTRTDLSSAAGNATNFPLKLNVPSSPVNPYFNFAVRQTYDKTCVDNPPVTCTSTEESVWWLGWESSTGTRTVGSLDGADADSLPDAEEPHTAGTAGDGITYSNASSLRRFVTSDPAPAVPEVPLAAMLPIGGAVTIGVALVLVRRRGALTP